MSKSLLRAAGPLDGVTVLELGSMYAAPTSGRMLYDFGARVIKVEDPVGGDFARNWVPQKAGLALGFARINAGKSSVGIDLRREEGRDLVRQLAAKVDVIIESFRPGRLEEWGLGYDVLSELNPKLILTRISGFGQTGPYKSRPGFGTVAETVSGYAYVNGWPDSPPTSPPFGFADSIAGISAAYGTAMALFRSTATGVGDVVDVALYEPLMFILGDIILRYTANNEIQQREGNSSGSASPRGIYVASDGGWLSIAASSQTVVERLFTAMGRPELITDKRYATNGERMNHNGELQDMVTSWVGSMSRDEVLSLCEEYEVVAAPVNDAKDISEDAHFNERTLVEFYNESLGTVKMPGPVLHLGSFDGPKYGSIPLIGADTDFVLQELLHLTDSDLGKLRECGAISPTLDRPKLDWSRVS